jgi:predicted negative regulator of RcsB-dependent stress response
VDGYLDERERWEALLLWLRTNGPAILIGVLLAVLGYGGLRWWQGRIKGRDLAASVLYQHMEHAFASGDEMAAVGGAGEIERHYADTPYVDQARLASAAAFVQTGHLHEAAAALTAVMQHPHDRILGLIARERLARVQIALHQPLQALATLDAINPGAFAPRYDMVRGDAYDALGKKGAALAQYRLAQASNPGGEVDSRLLGLEISELAANRPRAKSTAHPAVGSGPMPVPAAAAH